MSRGLREPLDSKTGGPEPPRYETWPRELEPEATHSHHSHLEEVFSTVQNDPDSQLDSSTKSGRSHSPKSTAKTSRPSGAYEQRVQFSALFQIPPAITLKTQLRAHGLRNRLQVSVSAVDFPSDTGKADDRDFIFATPTAGTHASNKYYPCSPFSSSGSYLGRRRFLSPWSIPQTKLFIIP